MLSKDEAWFLRIAFPQGDAREARRLNDLKWHLMTKLRFMQVDEVIDALTNRNVLSVSPDGTQVALSDHGRRIVHAHRAAQQQWEQQPGRAETRAAQTLIPAGAMFLANQILRDLLRLAVDELRLIDPYIDSTLYDHLYESARAPRIRILTDTVPNATRLTHAAFASDHGDCELRTLSGVLHDRMALWDGNGGVAVGHSFKDLGKKDTQVIDLATVAEHWKLFDRRWQSASPV